MKTLSEIIKENEESKKFSYKLNVVITGTVDATSESNAGETVDQIVDTIVVQDGQVDDYTMVSIDEIKNEGGYINPDLMIKESEEKDYTLDYINKNGLKTGIFNNVEEMKAHVETNFQKALDVFAAKHNIEVPLKMEIKNIREVDYIGFTSEDITDPNIFGIFKHSIKSVTIDSFNSSKIEGTNYKDQFYCSKSLWMTIHLSYEIISGGTNGLSYPIDGNDSLYYYFDDMTIHTTKEASAKEEHSE